MGSTISNLDSLLRMPYGCGEQNMLNFAPNIYVRDYLNATEQLTAELREKSTTNMVAGAPVFQFSCAIEYVNYV